MGNLKENIIRDGTGQRQRLLKLLDPSRLQIEEKGLVDYLRIAKTIAKEIIFFNKENIKEGTWSQLFPNASSFNSLLEEIQFLENNEDILKTSSFSPHLSLFVSFAKLLNYLKQDINGLTKSHLDYYYKTIIGIQPTEAQADKINVLFQLSKNARNTLLRKNTSLSAGKDPISGKEIIYTLDNDIIVNKIKIADLKSLLVDRGNLSRVFCAPVANSLDGNGKALVDENLGWPTMGESQFGKLQSEMTMIPGRVGFAMASPNFLLEDGRRDFTLTLSLRAFRLSIQNLEELENVVGIPNSVIQKLNPIIDKSYPSISLFNQQIQTLLGPLDYATHSANILGEVNAPLRNIDNINSINSDIFKIDYTSAEEWVKVNALSVNKLAENSLQISFRLPPDKQAFQPLKEKIDPLPFSEFPILKVELNHSSTNYLYQQLSGVLIDQATVDIEVEGISTVVLQNDKGIIDNTQPFYPFGTSPSTNTSFIIGSKEIFSKELDSLSINYEWADLPTDALGFDGFYDRYEQATPPHFPNNAVNNNYFKASFQLLVDGAWSPVLPNSDQQIQLFQGITNNVSEPLDTGQHTRSLSLPANQGTSNQAIDILEKYIPNRSQRGFGRLVFDSANDFGHRAYPRILSEEIALIAAGGTGALGMPNPPYTPKLNYLSIDYTTSLTIDFSTPTDHFEFFYLAPFGFEQWRASHPSFLLPLFQEGNLFLGLQEFQPPGVFNFLFQSLEGSADPLVTIRQEDIRWHYYTANGWKAIEGIDILQDSTFGLQTSGIVSLNIGSDASNESTVLPKGNFWVRVSTEKSPSGINRAIEINPNASSATLVLKKGAQNQFNGGLLPNSIRNLKSKNAAIKSVRQPYASYGGKLKETELELYTRVSERLRHKNRSVTVWDYERMVLHAFPEIYKVKCLNHSSLNSGLSPGEVVLVVIPDLSSNLNSVDVLKPRVGGLLRNKIGEYVKKFTSPYVEIAVENPKYESILVEAKIGLKPGFDGGFYGDLLNREIIQFLSPWAFEDGEEIAFRNRIYKSQIVAFIESQEYVDYITDMKLFHIDAGNGIGEMCVGIDFIVYADDIGQPVNDFAEASSARSILVSARAHQLTILNPGEFICTSSQSGIGFMAVGVDFEVAP